MWKSKISSSTPKNSDSFFEELPIIAVPISEPRFDYHKPWMEKKFRQLEITRRKYCLYYVWTSQSKALTNNKRNEKFWNIEMFSKLIKSLELLVILIGELLIRTRTDIEINTNYWFQFEILNYRYWSQMVKEVERCDSY